MTSSYPAPRIRQTLIAFLLLTTSLLAEPVPLKRVVELALSHATGAAIATADEQHAAAGYRELHNSYIPQLTTGAGLGPPSYGFPLALEGQAPSLFNINAQSSLWNPQLRDFIRAAKIESQVASLRSKDERNQIIQDAVLSYIELNKWERRLSRLRETADDAEKMKAAVAERVKAGVDSELDGIRARLSAARMHQRLVEAQGSADVLREHLSKLTGLAATEIETEEGSLPEFPAAPQEASAASALSTPSAQNVDANPAVQAAVEHARAQYVRAEGEHRAWWPSFDFAAQYAVLSNFNNFQDYYIPEKECTTPIGTFLCPNGGFHQNNATVGVSIRFPFLNFSQRSRAEAADADALKASKQAEAAKNQASEDELRLRRSVAQLQAARDVAQLEYEMAQKSLEAVHTRMDAGTANMHDLDDTRTQVSEKFMALQDVSFELQRIQLALLRATGELERWALGR